MIWPNDPFNPVSPSYYPSIALGIGSVIGYAVYGTWLWAALGVIALLWAMILWYGKI